jgi:simple sugar transport system permease protein
MIISLLARTITMGTPLLYGSLSEVYSERSGVMNTAIEGSFLLGAWPGCGDLPHEGNLVIGLLAAILAGVLTAALYGWITIYLKQHQIVTGRPSTSGCRYLRVFQRVIFGIPITPLIVRRSSNRHPSAIKYGDRTVLFNQNILTICFLFWCSRLICALQDVFGLSIRSSVRTGGGRCAGLKVEQIRFLTILLPVSCAVSADHFIPLATSDYYHDLHRRRGWIAFAICFLETGNRLAR